MSTLTTPLHKPKKTNRILYLDIARGLAVFFMVMQHAMIMHENTGGEGSNPITVLFMLLGTAPAAPVFLLILGLFVAKSKSTSKQLAWRGLKLFIAGYVLNIFRFAVPLAVAGESVFSPTVLSLLGLVDIFQVAGLSFLCLALVKQFDNDKRNHPWMIPSIATLILLISPFLWQIGGPFPDVNPLWGTGPNVDFPFFPWVFYPLMGYAFSQLLVTPKLTPLTQRKLIKGAIIAASVGAAALTITPIGDYYRSGLGVHYLMSAFVILWLLVCHWLSHRLEAANVPAVIETLSFLSQNVTSLYVCQWLLYGFSLLFIGSRQFSASSAVLIGLVVMVLSSLLCYLLSHLNINARIGKNGR